MVSEFHITIKTLVTTWHFWEFAPLKLFEKQQQQQQQQQRVYIYIYIYNVCVCIYAYFQVHRFHYVFLNILINPDMNKSR